MRNTLSEIAVENRFCAEQQNLTLNKNIVNLVSHNEHNNNGSNDEVFKALQQANKAYR